MIHVGWDPLGFGFGLLTIWIGILPFRELPFVLDAAVAEPQENPLGALSLEFRFLGFGFREFQIKVLCLRV